MLTFLVLAACVLGCAVATDLSNPNSGGGGLSWSKMNGAMPVCFAPIGNAFGSFYNHGPERLVGAIKLVYRSGFTRCVHNVAYNSKWGCFDYPGFKKHPLNVVVTDKFNEVIYPKKEFIRFAPGLWYYKPFINSLHSKELVFDDFGRPFYLPENAELRLWFGEDLTGWGEGDNQGRICVDVYAKYVN